MDMELIYTRRVVHVCHDLIYWYAHFLVYLLARLSVERYEHRDVSASEVPERPKCGISGDSKPLERIGWLSVSPAALDGLQWVVACGEGDCFGVCACIFLVSLL